MSGRHQPLNGADSHDSLIASGLHECASDCQPSSTYDFLATVRAALDDYDDTLGRDHWVIRDSDRFARVLLTHMLAGALAAALAADEPAQVAS